MSSTPVIYSDVGRVVWINGPFSAGKTTVAELLVRALPAAFLLDPEAIGAVLRDRLVPPELYPGDYQDIGLWRSFTRAAVIDAAQRFDGVVVVPMTVARADYFDEVIGASAASVRVDHFTLIASRETLLRREATRPGWGRLTVDRVLPALAEPRYAEHIDVERQGPEAVVEHILRRLNIPGAGAVIRPR